MPATTTEVCNMALLKCATNQISDYSTDVTPNGVKCRMFYPLVSDAMLRSYSWNFAQTRTKLTQEADTPSSGYDYAYILPTNPYCLRVLGMIDPDTDEYYDALSYPWQIEGREFLCDVDDVYIRYIKRADISEYDSLAAMCLVYLLAAELYPAIKQGEKLPAEIYEFLIKIWLPTTRSVDAQEKSTRQMHGGSLLQSRIL